jgi:excisionase family DNA binding protein
MGIVYALLDPRTGDTRYIGQTNRGGHERLSDHYHAAARGSRLHLSCWLRVLFGLGLEPVLAILEETDEVLQREQFWIKHYRDRGAPLTNLTAGGEGSLGFMHADETRARIAAARQGQTLTEQAKAKLSAFRKGKKHTEESKAKMRRPRSPAATAKGLETRRRNMLATGNQVKIREPKQVRISEPKPVSERKRMPAAKKPRELKNEELFSIRNAAKYKGVSVQAVYQRIEAGHLPFLRAGDEKAARLVYKRDLDAWDVDRDRQIQDRRRKAEN